MCVCMIVEVLYAFPIMFTIVHFTHVLLCNHYSASQFLFSTRDLGDFTGFEGHSRMVMCQGGEPDTSEFQFSCICMNLCCSGCENACMANGMLCTAANLA